MNPDCEHVGSHDEYLVVNGIPEHGGCGVAYLIERPLQSMASIARSLGINPSACTQVVDSLVEQMLLERSAEPTGRRVVSVDLSDSGQRSDWYVAGQQPAPR